MCLGTCDYYALLASLYPSNANNHLDNLTKISHSDNETNCVAFDPLRPHISSKLGSAHYLRLQHEVEVYLSFSNLKILHQ